MSRIGYSPKTPESPRTRKEPLSPRLSSIRKNLFPSPKTTRLEEMSVATAEAVWTEKLQMKVGEFIIALPEDNDVAAKASGLIKKTSGLTPGLSDRAAIKVKELSDDVRSMIFLRTCDLLAQDSTEGEVRTLLEAIKKAACELDPDFDAEGLRGMQVLVTGLGSGNPEATERCGRNLQAIVEQRSGRYGRKDDQLDRETGRLAYLGRWAKTALVACDTDELAAMFDGLMSNIRTEREPINSRISTAILDEMCPRIVGSLTKAVIDKETKTDEVDRFYRFLYFCLSRGSLSEHAIAAGVDDALESSAYSNAQLQQMVRDLSARNETVGGFIGERVKAMATASNRHSF